MRDLKHNYGHICRITMVTDVKLAHLPLSDENISYSHERFRRRSLHDKRHNPGDFLNEIQHDSSVIKSGHERREKNDDR